MGHECAVQHKNSRSGIESCCDDNETPENIPIIKEKPK